jgi:O-antigen biosynthesis protein
MQASIIVITRNRSASIAESLEALSGQECPEFEVLVVDSSDEPEREPTAKVVRQYGAKYVLEPRRGQALARNTGMRQASGKILAFTDDDCIPAKDWLAQKVRNFAAPAVWGCTGRVVQYSRSEASDLCEEVAGQDLGCDRRVFTGKDIQVGAGFLLGNLTKVFSKHMKSSAPVPYCIGHGSSMCFRREAFEQIGGFDERFGGGAPLGGCEDMEMLYRTLKSNHSIVYEPLAVVRHKHRLTKEEVFKTRYVYSFAGAAFMRQYHRDALMLVMFYGRLLQLVLKSTQYRLTGNKELAQSFKSDLRGFMAGWAAYRKFAQDSSAQANKPALLQKLAAR